MRGLRTQETEKFIKFLNMIQEEAYQHNSVFFVDCGMGNVYENDEIECEDLCGWLIPYTQLSQFEPLFMKNSEKQHEYDDYYCRVDFEICDGAIRITLDM